MSVEAPLFHSPILKEIAIAKEIIVEGPPIYAFPMPQYRSQHWQSPEFAHGWKQLSGMARIMEKSTSVSHWVMIDDVNNRPVNSAPVSINQTLQAIQQQTGEIPLFDRVDVAYLESEFINDPKKAKCATLDASFQMHKMSRLSYTPEETKLVICHPLAFQNQQRMMLEHLLAEMKTSQVYSTISKNSRRELLRNLFLHLWVDENGIIDQVTKPVWQKNSFGFELLPY